MPEQPRKMSEIMKEMSETLLRNPGGVPSSEAAHVALFFANVAWNESVGLAHAREGFGHDSPDGQTGVPASAWHDGPWQHFPAQRRL